MPTQVPPAEVASKPNQDLADYVGNQDSEDDSALNCGRLLVTGCIY